MGSKFGRILLDMVDIRHDHVMTGKSIKYFEVKYTDIPNDIR